MARIAQRDNVRAIRPGIAIPPQREEDLVVGINARLAKSYQNQAYALAQTHPDSKDHRFALHMAGIDQRLPRNNLRLIVTPVTPRAEWFDEAQRKVRIARAELELADSRWMHAWQLDRWDEGKRAEPLNAERAEKQAAHDLAILDALRTPVTKRSDALRKQDMIGKREWSEKYRPDWQAIVDEDLARFPTKARQPRPQEGR